MTRPIGCLLALLVAVLVVIATPRAAPDPARDQSRFGAPQAGRYPIRPEVRESAVGWHRYPDLMPSGAPTPTRGSRKLVDTLTGTPNDVTWQGTISYVSASYGPRYLALPLPVGTTARICGPAACLTRTSTDYGPDQRVHPDRIADVSAADFPVLCGVPLRFGLCSGSVTIERRAGLPTLPPTSTEGGTE